MSDDKKNYTPEELAELCFKLCEDKKASDIVVFDVREKTIIADYYVVRSGTSQPHILAIGDNIRRGMMERGMEARGTDGDAGSRWMILDYGTVLVHILEPEMRNFYALEQLWDEEKIIRRGGESILKP